MTVNEQTFEGRRVLITGGLGFIGSNLAQRLLDLGAKVKLVDSLIPEYGGNLFNIEEIRTRLRVNIADVRDEHGMRYLLPGGDYVAGEYLITATCYYHRHIFETPEAVSISPMQC